MSVSKDLKALCYGLDQFRVATALGHEGEANLVCWNETFQEVTGFGSDELKALSVSRILVWENEAASVKPPSVNGLAETSFFPCVLRPPDFRRPIPGRATRRSDGYVLVLLDQEALAEPELVITGDRLLGRQEEADRVRKVIHDEVSSDLLAASFGVHSVNAKLQARDAPESAEMAQAVGALDQAIQRLIAAFSVEQPGVIAV
ncbi:MAG TPA: hypothetical protein VGD78_11795 [Chthoniobacterales bacterium]